MRSEVKQLMSASPDSPSHSFPEPGVIALFGSGERSPSGRKIFESIFQLIPDSPQVAILETPAGFELNSAQVAEEIAEYLRHHLRNYDPQVVRIEARKRGTAFSPDDPQIVKQMLNANMVFMGPGSPTYAVKQLKSSLAWDYLVARHRLGAGLALASAATIAISTYVLPVYEIYKVGEDIHWKEGLDFFGDYGLSLAFIPHWNNREGGEGLDTSRCFMGQTRIELLFEMLPDTVTVVGIDERTGLIIDLVAKSCRVIGEGVITLLRQGNEKIFSKHQIFPVSEMGEFRDPDPEAGISSGVWEIALNAHRSSQVIQKPPWDVLDMLQAREAAREDNNWADADLLKSKIEQSGWQISDTPNGPKIIKKGK